MSTNSADVTNPSMATLLSGIFADVHNLAEQQLLLTKTEIEEELTRRASAAKILICAVSLLFLSANVFCFSMIHLLHWVSSAPDSDSSRLPLWACHALIGLFLAGLGFFFGKIGQIRMKAISHHQLVLIKSDEE